MVDFMKTYEDQTYALLRIVSGFLFIFHGCPKLMTVMSGEGATYVHYIAGPIEVIGGLMIMCGVFTSCAAFIASGLMAVAYWMVHYGKMGGGWPFDNKGELAVMFCFVYLYIAAKGSGIWRLETLLRRYRERLFGN